MGGANQYREAGEWTSEHQTELTVGSDGYLPLSGTTNQGDRVRSRGLALVNEGGTAGFPVLHVYHEWMGKPFSYSIE